MQHIGRHIARPEKDLILYTVLGDLSDDELRHGVELLGPIIAEHGYCYIIADLAEMGSLDVAARRETSRHPNLKHLRAYAGISPSMVTRTLVTLALRALAVFQGNGLRIDFFSTEGEARAWIDKLRQEAQSR